MTPDSESNAPQPEDDDGLEWLREIRRKMAAECNYDPYEMGRRLREQERTSGRTFYRTERVLVPVGTVDSVNESELSCVVREEPPANRDELEARRSLSPRAAQVPAQHDIVVTSPRDHSLER